MSTSHSSPWACILAVPKVRVQGVQASLEQHMCAAGCGRQAGLAGLQNLLEGTGPAGQNLGSDPGAPKLLVWGAWACMAAATVHIWRRSPTEMEVKSDKECKGCCLVCHGAGCCAVLACFHCCCSAY